MLAFLVRLFGIALMLTAIAVPLSRAPDRAPETLVARWAPRPSDFIEVRGQMVHLRDEGPRNDPHPLLLLHGTAASLHTWQGWVGVLRAQHRVISLDLPGAGLTGPFAGEYARDDYRGDTLARFTLDLMDALKLPRVVLVGNSLGGEVAWRVATLAPARVDRLVLIDASGLAVAPQAEPLAMRLASQPVLGWLGEQMLPRGLVEASLESLYADPRRITPALVDRYFELALREGNRHALRLRLQQRSQGEDAGRLAALQVPTLVLWGGKDRLIPPAAGAEFARRIPGARLQVFEDLGHLPQEEDPLRSVRALQDFLGPR